MKRRDERDDQVRETLMQVCLELEASARAAREAATCSADDRACWRSLQQMYARLNQASYYVACFQKLYDGRDERRTVGDEADPS